MPRARTEQLTPEQLADRLCNWLNGDHGPFGWNDQANIQTYFNRMSKARRLAFIDLAVAKIKADMIEKARD